MLKVNLEINELRTNLNELITRIEFLEMDLFDSLEAINRLEKMQDNIKTKGGNK